MRHFWLAQYCSINDLDSFCNVGESRGISVKLGSSYPKITNRAFALWDFLVSLTSWGSNSFQVRIHLLLRRFASGILFLVMARTVPVSNHWSTSFIFAFSNSATSSGCRSLIIFTSDLCFLAVVAKKLVWSTPGLVSSLMSCSVIIMSKIQPCFCPITSSSLTLKVS